VYLTRKRLTGELFAIKILRKSDMVCFLCCGYFKI
jgi:hypothetical protein